MALSENPKKIAGDVAQGLQTFNSANLRRYDAADLKTLMEHLNASQVALRQEVLTPDDPQYQEKVQEKNRKMGRIRNAVTVIRGFAHRRGMKGL